MKNLDNYEQVSSQIEYAAKRFLFLKEHWRWKTLPRKKRQQKLKALLCAPLADFSIVYTLYFRWKWVDIFQKVMLPTNATVLEIGAGASDMIPKALYQYSNVASYITVNMNQALAKQQLRKTRAMKHNIQIIADDANNIQQHLHGKQVDCLVFEHSCNDILQTFLAEQYGIDTTNSEWFSILPDMIRLINEQYESGTFEQSLKELFMHLLNACLCVLKPGGLLVISHYMFQMDLDWGYNPSLWEDMLLLIKPWLLQVTELAEEQVSGLDPQWWLVMRKV